MATARTAEVVIYQGDDLARLGELNRLRIQAKERLEQAKAQAGVSGRIGDAADPKPSQDAQAAFDTAVDEAAERAETVVIQAIGYAHRELRLAHPPRMVKRLVDGEQTEVVHDDDQAYGVDTSTYPLAVLSFVDEDDETLRTIAAPDFAGEQALKKWLRRQAEGDFDKLWMVAYHLNTELSADPKASRSYAETPTSSVTFE